MRVSTSQIFNIANIGMANAQSAVTKTQEQIATGKRVLSPADDPVAATQILQLTQEVARTEQFSKNIDIAENNLNLEEVALKSITNLVQRMQELAVSAGNTAVLTTDDYKAIIAEADSRIDELLNLQNTRNASGQYIFAGYQGATKPFEADGGGNYSYHGDEGQLRLNASDSVTVPVSDSGKRIFVDVESSHNTFYTEASASNEANPPARISVGEVVDQELFDELYPDDLVIRFNNPSDTNPPASNFTVLERTSGKVLLANERYVDGGEIEVAGAKFNIFGAAYPGQASTPATLPFTFGAPVDFSAAASEVNITVGGRTETLVLDQNVTNAADLANALTATANTVANSGASQNAAKLSSLGINVDATGFSVAGGWNVTVAYGDANTDSVMGFATTGVGTTSVDGVVGEAGDSFTVNSTQKQGLLTSLSRFSQAMKEFDGSQQSRDHLEDVVAKTITNLDNAVTNLSIVQGEVGARLNTLESAKELNADNKLYTETVLSDLRDLDYAEAATRLEIESFVLSASQQSFIKVSNLSLFNFLS
ncbi:flagellar hook-associated protein FlgL [Gilvimarinus sp. SDUM040013]|uniref:Flagellar hook-associated protein FlgL n=1 Tax=Gilvimarinus gilvus TaxID=3058038 RepID=A0ABU4RU92_9GAMM|nr:flagellar hook-associated protein FlgL [Gilvimarinus sp. SDUM040013]MDO3385075.1 flagellar hook-associated protein FlgL [Gilvimarinus sp. SDUM040013]MDX6848450.1 flagellar hook-associated protein FlgL [Gilvimarinus sp. SDUM040013]